MLRCSVQGGYELASWQRLQGICQAGQRLEAQHGLRHPHRQAFQRQVGRPCVLACVTTCTPSAFVALLGCGKAHGGIYCVAAVFGCACSFGCSPMSSAGHAALHWDFELFACMKRLPRISGRNRTALGVSWS